MGEVVGPDGGAGVAGLEVDGHADLAAGEVDRGGVLGGCGLAAHPDAVHRDVEVGGVERGGVVPMEASTAPMSTKFGRKSKPTLKVVGWRNTAASVMIEQPDRQLPSPAAAATTAPAAAKPHDMDDDIPF